MAIQIVSDTNINDNILSQVPDPTADQHAVNRRYLESYLEGSVGGGKLLQTKAMSGLSVDFDTTATEEAYDYFDIVFENFELSAASTCGVVVSETATPATLLDFKDIPGRNSYHIMYQDVDTPFRTTMAFSFRRENNNLNPITSKSFYTSNQSGEVYARENGWTSTYSGGVFGGETIETNYVGWALPSNDLDGLRIQFKSEVGSFTTGTAYLIGRNF